MKKAVQALDVLGAIRAWPGLYQTKSGRKFWGTPVSQIPKALRAQRWRGVAHLNYEPELEELGLEIVTARYVQGVHPKQFCRVVVADPYQEKETAE